METFSTSLALCAGNSPVTGEFPSQRPVTRSFDVFFDLRKRLSKQSWGWWFETPSRSLWRHCNVAEYETFSNRVLKNWLYEITCKKIWPSKEPIRPSPDRNQPLQANGSCHVSSGLVHHLVRTFGSATKGQTTTQLCCWSTEWPQIERRKNLFHKRLHFIFVHGRVWTYAGELEHELLFLNI